MKNLATLFHRAPRQTRTLIQTVVAALAASLAAVAFQITIQRIFKYVYFQHSHLPLITFGLISFASLCFAALIGGVLLQWLCPEAAGSGIPQVKLSFWKKFGQSPKRIAVVKFIACTLGIGGGLSLGREGPSVQIGSSLSSMVANILGASAQERRAAVAAGAAASLAAAFNAPLAGVAFVLEELLEDLNSRLIGPVLLAAVIGALSVHYFIGPDPAFTLPRIGEPDWMAYVMTPFVALIASLIGVFFQRGTISLRGYFKGMKTVPLALRPLFGAVVTWLCGFSLFALTGKLGVFGVGYATLSEALDSGMIWWVAVLLLLAKWLATVSCYGSGNAGGIFSPCLFFGAMCGCGLYGAVAVFMGHNESDRILLAVVGMSACLGAVVQAPVTSVLIIFEMTHQFQLLPGLMIAGLISQIVARKMVPENFYEEILVQDGHQAEHIVPPRNLRDWQELPVSAIANFQPINLKSLLPDALREVIESYPYQCFPVIQEERMVGFVTRQEIEIALLENRLPHLSEARNAKPSLSVREIQGHLIESTAGFVTLGEKEDSPPIAVVTLHDLLRAQITVSEQE